MKNRFVLFIVIIAAAFAGGLCFLMLTENKSQNLDTAAVNDVVMTYSETGDREKTFAAADKYDFSVTILDENEKLVAQKGNSGKNLTEATALRQAVVSLSDNRGYVIVSDNYENVVSGYKKTMLLSFTVCAGIILAAAVMYALYIYQRVVKPFDKLRSFATRVAQGNLDSPLEMDRGNIFGAFTESFDIMREELAASREREREANQSKKELVASLSHDIKTPVASIRATAELLEVMTEDEKISVKLEGIEKKTEQIELLINNLFNATLEELQALEVKNSDEPSTVVSELISFADYSGLVQPFTVPECIINCDKLRLGQVFDNIISNSYKYADTQITVKSYIEDDFLITELSDKGAGLDDDEAERCCDKFFRGKNSQGKNGSGLGLYISSYFCGKMGGGLEVKSENGFIVRVIIPLAG